MTTLLTIRDNIIDFVAKYEKFVLPVLKFIGVVLVLISYNSTMGYSSQMSNPMMIFILAFICAFIPVTLIVLLCGIVGFFHMYAVSMEIGLVYVGIFALMYLLYLRFAPKYGWIVILMPLLYLLKLHYIIPVVISIFVGPAGIVPMAFGIIFYYLTVHVNELVELLATTTEEDSIQGFSYVLNGLLQDKAMLLTIVVFILIIAITYIIYRQSFEYSWMVAIGTGAVLNIILLLVGGIVLEVDINILVIFLGTVGGALLALVAQFFKGVLDYSRTEVVQFEDNDYYYYVKAVPKVRVAEQNVTIKKINEQTVRESTSRSEQEISSSQISRQVDRTTSSSRQTDRTTNSSQASRQTNRTTDRQNRK